VFLISCVWRVTHTDSPQRSRYAGRMQMQTSEDLDAIQQEMLARFEASLDQLVEESLGPLLAAGGALDPVTARAIARQTSTQPLRVPLATAKHGTARWGAAAAAESAVWAWQAVH